MATYNDEQAIRSAMSEGGFVVGEVLIDLADVIGRDLEQFLDLISEALVGSDLLMNVGYTLTGVTEDGLLVMTVTGDPSAILEEDT